MKWPFLVKNALPVEKSIPHPTISPAVANTIRELPPRNNHCNTYSKISGHIPFLYYLRQKHGHHPHGNPMISFPILVVR